MILAQYFVEKGRALGFVTYSPYREIVQPDRGPRQLTRILEILAIARSETQFSLRQMLALEAGYLGRGTTAIIVTASTDPGWAAEAHTLSRRGIRVIAVLVDPQSFGAPQENHTNFRERHQDMVGRVDDSEDIIPQQNPGHQLADDGRHPQPDAEFTQEFSRREDEKKLKKQVSGFQCV